MKRYELLFWIIKVPIEFAIVIGAFFLARHIRLVTDLIPRVHLPIQTIKTESLINFAFTGAILFIVLFSISGLYKIRMYQSKIQETKDVMLASMYWFFIYIACLYLSAGFLYTVDIPRLIILFSLVLIILGVITERLVLDSVERRLLKRWIFEKRKILVFLKNEEDDIFDGFDDSDIYEIIGYAAKFPIDSVSLTFIGGAEDVFCSIRNREIDEILVVRTDFSGEEIQEVFEYSRIYGVRYRYVANSFEASKMNTELSFFGKIPTIEIRSIGLTPWGRVMKRIFDIVVSSTALLLLSPVFLIVSAVIFFEDHHSVLYRSVRVGKNGNPFSMLKFRSMRIWADGEKHKLMEKNERTDGPLFKIENDPRITKFGSFIRQFDIDELPQLWNVFVGDMSLIGPRPHLPEEVKLYKEYQKRVLTLKPGITGMAQSHGRHKNSFDEEVRLDTFYIENWNLLLDIKILLKTIGVVLARKGR